MADIQNRKTRPRLEINKTQIFIGFAALLLGTLVYIIDRPPGDTYFVSNSGLPISLHCRFPNLFGAAGNSLPDFIHPFSFILITAGILSCRRNGHIITSLAWLTLDLVFEFGQKYKEFSLRLIPECFEGIPFLENSANYFKFGTFDIMDVAAIILGTLLAFIVLILTDKNLPQNNTCSKF